MGKKITLFLLVILQASLLSCDGCHNDNFNKRLLAYLAIPTAGSSYDPDYTIPETVPTDAIFVDQNDPDAGDDIVAGRGSEDYPYLTIQGALSGANPGPGDTVVVKTGTYHENNLRVPSGEEGNPFTLMGHPGQRVIVSGLEILSASNGYAWTDEGGGIYSTTISWKPVRLLRITGGADPKFSEQPCGRYPDDGWLAVDSVTNGTDQCTFTDSALAGLTASQVVGGEAFMSLTEGNLVFPIEITAFDEATNTITIPRSQYTTLTYRTDDYGNIHADRYILRNKVNFINAPGEWAVEQPDPDDDSRFTLYYMPYDSTGGTVADTIGISGHQLQRIIFCNQTRYANVVGLEVVGSDQYGIQTASASGVVIGKCVTHHNGSVGIYISSSEDTIVARNISWWNGIWSIGGSNLGTGGTGIAVTGSSRVLVEMNDMAYNGSDGLHLTWGSDNLTARKNYIHHHLFWGHPDNIQLFRTVRNYTIKDNLLIGGGQSIMIEETSNADISGNIIIGCGAYSVITGDPNLVMHRNSILHSYYGCLTGEGIVRDIRENIFMTGNRGYVYSVRDMTGYSGDRNLFYNADIGYDGILVTDKGWGRTLAQFQDDTGQDRNSRFGDPEFANMPGYFTQVESFMIHLCGTDTLIISNGVDWLNTGDTIELNFDGVPRNVTAVTDNYDANHYSITITPALAAKPLRICLIAKWADSVSASQPMDATLAATSPGADLSVSGGPVGSSVNIHQYKDIGSFDGDDIRDIPDIQFE